MMNYDIVVMGGIVIPRIVWYSVGGHQEYKGPTMDEEAGAV
jgi:hypothetical protein